MASIVSTETPTDVVNQPIANRGTGAGGAGTNATGLAYESSTDLMSVCDIARPVPNGHAVMFHGDDTYRTYILTSQSKVFKYLAPHKREDIKPAHGCKKPDECVIDETAKRIFIIEKKFQHCSGSVCEKIQSSDFKLWQYRRLFPSHDIHYIYCLSDWFKTNCPAELEYLSEKNVPVFWGESPTYRQDIVSYILNC